ncbi:MAG TPA: hypothetical protein VFA49_00065, partial [Chloroflexota bacterium]|nr:hypothetical protein [Chloroflexota bacterium]
MLRIPFVLIATAALGLAACAPAAPLAAPPTPVPALTSAPAPTAAPKPTATTAPAATKVRYGLPTSPPAIT